MTDRVGLVLVSHSADLARGVAELAGQMAPDVPIRPAGGADDGGLGTSFDRITAALAELAAGGAVVLYDLGSALLTTETALEFLDDADSVEVVDAPLVEGALAAAVAAQGGGTRAEVAAAARTVGAPAGQPGPAPVPPPSPGAAGLARTVALRNPLGLHARPAAELVRALAGLQAEVTLARGDEEPVDARSLLAVIRLGTRAGDDVTVRATGPDQQQALDRVVELIEGGFGESPEAAAGNSTDRSMTDRNVTDRSVTDEAPRDGAPGSAVGVLGRTGLTEIPDVRADDAAAERSRLRAVVSAVSARLEGGDSLARAHAALLADPGLWTAAEAELDQGWSAGSAWWHAVTALSAALAADADAVVAARAVDVRDAGTAVLTELGIDADRVPPGATGMILLADELGPSEVTDFFRRGGVGIVLSRGTPTAHAVVVARGLGLPLVFGGASLADVPDGTVLAIDGSTGQLEVDPPDAASRQSTVISGDAAPVVVGGHTIVVAANIGSVAEAQAAVTYGADGVGLLRTELLLLDRPELPEEDRQRADLAEILAVLGQRPVVVRVLDVGGDKPVRALQLDPQRNGFLGVRGLRWLLEHPDVLHTQLRAISRAAVGHRVSIMAPMVSVPREAAAFTAAVDRALASLVADGLEHARPEHLGVMVEVPAAALAADEFGALVDFVSIGTNDLLAYTFAADRTEAAVADLVDPDSAAVHRLLEQVCQRAGVPVHVCGELAADPARARWFVERGVTELSMAAPRIPGVKQALRAG